MRTIYVVAPGTTVTTAIEAAANAAGASEIAQGIPPRLVKEGITGTYPFVYTEPDDPEKAPFLVAAAQLKNTYQTSRNATQINNSIDAITLILRKIVQELR